MAFILHCGAERYFIAPIIDVIGRAFRLVIGKERVGEYGSVWQYRLNDIGLIDP